MDVRETNVLILALILSVGIGTIICFFFASIIRQHKEKLELKNRHIIAELKSIEKERTRIAADLHDDLAPMLAAVRMRLNSLEVPEAEVAQVEKTNQIIDEMASRMRAISFDLMPGSLLAKGLETALRDLLNSFPPNSGLKIKLLTPGYPLSLDSQKTIHIYRIIKEIVHNTIKHAKASELSISLEQKDQTLTLSTKDNGIGFDLGHRTKESRGLGLSSIENRTTLLGGKSALTSKPGAGTTYFFEIPLT